MTHSGTLWVIFTCGRCAEQAFITTVKRRVITKAAGGGSGGGLLAEQNTVTRNKQTLITDISAGGFMKFPLKEAAKITFADEDGVCHLLHTAECEEVGVDIAKCLGEEGGCQISHLALSRDDTADAEEQL